MIHEYYTIDCNNLIFPIGIHAFSSYLASTSDSISAEDYERNNVGFLFQLIYRHSITLDSWNLSHNKLIHVIRHSVCIAHFGIKEEL